ncbi:hypothetical protein BRW84_05085 [Oxalobacter formigenes OXCC13]|nr:hypothetical protein BRW84_05085 [Oxalobacter formigenes OXCC13]
MKYRRKACQTNEKAAKFLIIFCAMTSKEKARNKNMAPDDLPMNISFYTGINKRYFRYCPGNTL